MRVAKKFGMKLVMAGKVDISDKNYFASEIKPYVDDRMVEFIGEITVKEKNRLLRNAYALLAPIQWREPFGLFLVEAMACGTPAVVTNMGAAPELVADGSTGFIVENDEDAFVAALKKIPDINRAQCRAQVEKYFTTAIMAERYEAVYRNILNQ